MLPGITPALMGGESGNDVYTKLLLHFNDTSFMNVAAGGTPSVATPNNTPIHTGEKRFGNASIYFQGGGASYVFVKNSPDFDFGAGSFTVDWWEKRFSVVAGSATVRRQLDNAVQGYLLNHATAGPRYQTYMSSNGSSWDIAGGIDSGSVDLDVWVHYAVVRNGNTFYHFKNGAQTATWSSSAALLACPANHALTLGHWNGNGFHGYIDEFRISKGIARWTSNFTPPGQAYGPTPDRSAWHTVGLYHFHTTNAAGTVFTDSSPYAKPGTGGNGYGHPNDPLFSNPAGSSYFNAGNYYNVIDGQGDWNFGSGDFTIDWWDWRSDTADARPGIVRSTETLTYQPYLIGWMSGGYLYCYGSSNATGWDVFSNLHLGPVTANVWSHRALARKGGTFYGFKDGVLTDTRPDTFGPLHYRTNPDMFVGVWNAEGAQYWGHGLMDELRISKGIARWTTNFTMPTRPY